MDEFELWFFRNEDGKLQEISYLELRPYNCSLAIRLNDESVEHFVKDNNYVGSYPFIVEDIAIKKIHIRPLDYLESGTIIDIGRGNAKYIYLAKY